MSNIPTRQDTLRTQQKIDETKPTDPKRFFRELLGSYLPNSDLVDKKLVDNIAKTKILFKQGLPIYLDSAYQSILKITGPGKDVRNLSDLQLKQFSSIQMDIFSMYASFLIWGTQNIEGLLDPNVKLKIGIEIFIYLYENKLQES